MLYKHTLTLIKSTCSHLICKEGGGGGGRLKETARLSLSLSLYISFIYVLAVSPLASSGFAAIECFRASPYGGIYILKNNSKLTAKKSAFFFENPNFFLPKTFPWPRLN